MDEHLASQVEEWKKQHEKELFYCEKNKCYLRESACAARQRTNKTVTHYYISMMEKKKHIDPEFVVCKGCKRWLDLENGGQYYRKPKTGAIKAQIERHKKKARNRRLS